MTIEEQVLQKLRGLPPEKQKEVLDFVDLLKEKKASPSPRRSLLGLWSDFGIEITEEDIAQARREMWGKFPRDIEISAPSSILTPYCVISKTLKNCQPLPVPRMKLRYATPARCMRRLYRASRLFTWPSDRDSL